MIASSLSNSSGPDRCIGPLLRALQEGLVSGSRVRRIADPLQPHRLLVCSRFSRQSCASPSWRRTPREQKDAAGCGLGEAAVAWYADRGIRRRSGRRSQAPSSSTRASARRTPQSRCTSRYRPATLGRFSKGGRVASHPAMHMEGLANRCDLGPIKFCGPSRLRELTQGLGLGKTRISVFAGMGCKRRNRCAPQAREHCIDHRRPCP